MSTYPSRWLLSVMGAIGAHPQPRVTTFDVFRFWNLVRTVRTDIQIGCISDRAKTEAAELFHLASLKDEAARRALAGSR